MRLVLIVPGLLALPTERLAAMRSLATLAASAPAPRIERRGIASALFGALGLATDAPVAPLALLGAGTDPGDDYVLCADPVHLAADRDTVVLVRRIDDLAESDADALVRTLNRHFADDDLRFEAVRPDAWFARRREPAAIVTTPLDAAVARMLLPHLPRGDDAGRWKRWQNEIEMLLHDQPANVERETRGAPAVTGVWFWGGGTLADAGALPAIVAMAASGRIGDLARGIARHGGGSATTLDMQAGVADALTRAATPAGSSVPCALVVLPGAGADTAALETRWLAPALERLARRELDTLRIVADGNGAAATWDAQRPPPLWQRIFARAAPRRFEVPALPDA